MTPTTTKNDIKAVNTTCYHCGDPCEKTHVSFMQKDFCCNGCQLVYEILNTNDLGQFYQIEKAAGTSLKGQNKEQYTYLDDAAIVEKLIDFSNEKITKATFYLPQIHCASCIWLLENLYKLDDGILASKVNFLKKEAYLTFANSATSYRKIVELLASIGYAPTINLSDLNEPKEKVVNKRFYYQLGVAGFAFGNIMLLSLPEYFGLTDTTFQEVFGYLNILLILPIVFYSGRDYLTAAWQGLRQRRLNIDVPIALGILTLFGRSVFEILTHTGAGYLDSLAGLVFFLLIGKRFQQATYYQLSFERDYKSYFPIAATVLKDGVEYSVALSQLNIGDIILLKNGELIPADGFLKSGKARIDYSFVTGESEPVSKSIGEKLYAGGRQMGGTIQLCVTKKVAQSYLTQLWNEDTFQKNKNTNTTGELANRIGKYFTYVILTIACATLAYWLPKDTATAINAFTAVLIIACPCAVALSIPFTFGNALRLLGRTGFYLKNTNVIEQLNKLDTIVFDKTGTITRAA
ncbi:MAG: heavy metal translocating P-type ATPase metal-binding domain-containing protein, partial [Bacteroidota bacterium]